MQHVRAREGGERARPVSRAMLPQWGLARSVLASSAFFAVLHPPLAWPMVFYLGALNAFVFTRTRSLLPCIVLHACYNAMVIGLS